MSPAPRVSTRLPAGTWSSSQAAMPSCPGSRLTSVQPLAARWSAISPLSTPGRGSSLAAYTGSRPTVCGRSQSVGEFAGEHLGAGIPVGLEQHGHRPAESLRHLHDGQHLGGMVAVVVQNQHAPVLPVFLATPADTQTGLQTRRRSSVERHPEFQPHGHGGQGVLKIVPSAQLQAERTQFLARRPRPPLPARNRRSRSCPGRTTRPPLRSIRR